VEIKQSAITDKPETKTERVIFENITQDEMASSAKNSLGSRGPTQIDMETWRERFCSKWYGTHSQKLDDEIATLAGLLKEDIIHAEGTLQLCSLCKSGIRHRSSNTCCKEKLHRAKQCMPAVSGRLGCRQCIQQTQQKSESRKHQTTVSSHVHILSHNTSTMLYLENGDYILSQEGVTQGDFAAMAMYALSTRPLTQALSN